MQFGAAGSSVQAAPEAGEESTDETAFYDAVDGADNDNDPVAIAPVLPETVHIEIGHDEAGGAVTSGDEGGDGSAEATQARPLDIDTFIRQSRATMPLQVFSELVNARHPCIQHMFTDAEAELHRVQHTLSTAGPADGAGGENEDLDTVLVCLHPGCERVGYQDPNNEKIVTWTERDNVKILSYRVRQRSHVLPLYILWMFTALALVVATGYDGLQAWNHEFDERKACFSPLKRDSLLNLLQTIFYVMLAFAFMLGIYCVHYLGLIGCVPGRLVYFYRRNYVYTIASAAGTLVTFLHAGVAEGLARLLKGVIVTPLAAVALDLATASPYLAEARWVLHIARFSTLLWFINVLVECGVNAVERSLCDPFSSERVGLAVWVVSSLSSGAWLTSLIKLFSLLASKLTSSHFQAPMIVFNGSETTEIRYEDDFDDVDEDRMCTMAEEEKRERRDIFMKCAIRVPNVASATDVVRHLLLEVSERGQRLKLFDAFDLWPLYTKIRSTCHAKRAELRAQGPIDDPITICYNSGSFRIGYARDPIMTSYADSASHVVTFLYRPGPRAEFFVILNCVVGLITVIAFFGEAVIGLVTRYRFREEGYCWIDVTGTNVTTATFVAWGLITVTVIVSIHLLHIFRAFPVFWRQTLYFCVQNTSYLFFYFTARIIDIYIRGPLHSLVGMITGIVPAVMIASLVDVLGPLPMTYRSQRWRYWTGAIGSVWSLALVIDYLQRDLEGKLCIANPDEFQRSLGRHILVAIRQGTIEASLIKLATLIARKIMHYDRPMVFFTASEAYSNILEEQKRLANK